MQIAKLFTSARWRVVERRMHAVVMCVDRSHTSRVTDGDIDILVGRLQRLVAERKLGEYDGCDWFSGESRLYLFSTAPHELASAALEIVRSLAWRDRVHVRISLDALGRTWLPFQQ